MVAVAEDHTPGRLGEKGLFHLLPVFEQIMRAEDTRHGSYTVPCSYLLRRAKLLSPKIIENGTDQGCIVESAGDGRRKKGKRHHFCPLGGSGLNNRWRVRSIRQSKELLLRI